MMLYFRLGHKVLSKVNIKFISLYRCVSQLEVCQSTDKKALSLGELHRCYQTDQYIEWKESRLSRDVTDSA
jgi:hypothetical protein